NRVILLPSEKTLYGVRRIVLEFRKQKLAAIVVEHSGGQEQWQIRSLRIDPLTRSDIFQFNVPPGVEVLDMR
ncbi:MAG: hypothetical protein N2663_05815, partial [Chlorobi bacterium]|nr:hypothetical protein [Chlorobiota bacterium]